MNAYDKLLARLQAAVEKARERPRPKKHRHAAKHEPRDAEPKRQKRAPAPRAKKAHRTSKHRKGRR